MAAEPLLIWLFRGRHRGLAGQCDRAGLRIWPVGNIIVGIIGSFLGGWLFGQSGIASGGGIVDSIVGATVGAVVLLFFLRIVRHAA